MAKVYYITEIVFECIENHITVGDSKCRFKMPCDGEILGNRNTPLITGSIQDTGTGAGTATVFQIRNVTQNKDYFSTKPEFRVNDKDGNNRALLAATAVLGNYYQFKANDELALDVDTLPGGADSAYMQVMLTVGMWRSVA